MACELDQNDLSEPEYCQRHHSWKYSLQQSWQDQRYQTVAVGFI